MKLSIKKLAWFIIAFCLSGNLAAAENAGTSAQRTKEAPDMSQSASSAAGKTLEGFGKTLSGNSGAVPEMKPVAATSDKDAAVEKKPLGVPAARPSPALRRDPFRPFTLNARGSPNRRRENLSPLERYELGQLKLVAEIWNTKEPTAMVEDSSRSVLRSDPTMEKLKRSNETELSSRNSTLICTVAEKSTRSI